MKSHERGLMTPLEILGNAIASLVKYQISDEWHPDEPDKAGDEA